MTAPLFIGAPVADERSPFERELDRLIDQRARGYLSEPDFRAERARLERAQIQAGRA